MTQAILSVVRYRENPVLDRASHYVFTEWYRNKYTPEEQEEIFADDQKHHSENLAGKYIGSGGHLTDDMQKAQVWGWSRKAQDKLEVYRVKSTIYEVIPILLVPAKEGV